MIDYRRKDADGRIPLSFREYDALKTIFGAFNALTLYHGQLEKRCKGYKNGWRDLRLLVKYSERVMESVLLTVPTKKLLQIRKELNNTICIVKTQGITGKDVDGYMYVREDTIIDLCKAATDLNCFGCDKSHKEAKRNCKLYKDIQSIFNYEFDDCENCPFSDVGAIE